MTALALQQNWVVGWHLIPIIDTSGIAIWQRSG
jgi:hypothetical protein